MAHHNDFIFAESLSFKPLQAVYVNWLPIFANSVIFLLGMTFSHGASLLRHLLHIASIIFCFCKILSASVFSHPYYLHYFPNLCRNFLNLRKVGGIVQ